MGHQPPFRPERVRRKQRTMFTSAEIDKVRNFLFEMRGHFGNMTASMRQADSLHKTSFVAANRKYAENCISCLNQIEYLLSFRERKPPVGGKGNGSGAARAT